MSPQPDPRLDPSRLVQAPRGTTLHCKSWVTEAAYRMIQTLSLIPIRRRRRT